jgi:hypothetical protein
MSSAALILPYGTIGSPGRSTTVGNPEEIAGSAVGTIEAGARVAIEFAEREMDVLTVESPREHLQWAIDLEHFTLPPYLCALYSLDSRASQRALHGARPDSAGQGRATPTAEDLP